MGFEDFKIIDILTGKELKGAKLLNTSFKYGGHSCEKQTILYADNLWMVKFGVKPKRYSTHNKTISSYHSCISEWLGSHIFDLLGVPCQETKLVKLTRRGINEQVVCCRHLYDMNMNSGQELWTFRDIQRILLKDNNYSIPDKLQYFIPQQNGAVDNSESLEKFYNILETFDFGEIDVEQHFWRMLIIDYLIANTDRNSNNWGFIYNRKNCYLIPSPVFDNGSSFHGRILSDIILRKYSLSNEINLEDVFQNILFPTTKNGKRINLANYLNNDIPKKCIDAILDIVPKIDLHKINEIIDSLKRIHVLSEARASFYKESIRYRENNILKPALNNYLKSQEYDNSCSFSPLSL